MDKTLDPYSEWLGIESKQRPPTLYQLLRLDPADADGPRIEQAAERQIAALEKHLAGPHSRLARRTLYELESAKQCLLDPEKRTSYDAALQNGFVAPTAAVTTSGAAESPAPAARPPSRPAAPATASADSHPRCAEPVLPMAILLDEVLPAIAEPTVPAPNLSALRLPIRSAAAARKQSRAATRNAALVIALPAVALLGLTWLAVGWLDTPQVAMDESAAQPATPTAARPLDRGSSSSNPANRPTSAGVSIPSRLAPSLPFSPRFGAYVNPPGANSAKAPPTGGDNGVDSPPSGPPSADNSAPVAPPSASTAAPSEKPPEQRGSKLGGEKPAPASSSSVAGSSAQAISPWVVNLDKETTRIRLDDTGLPRSAMVKFEVLGCEGFPANPKPSSEWMVAEGEKPLRIIARETEPRLEIRMQISGQPGRRMLNLMPALVDTDTKATTYPFTNERVNTMVTQLPGQLDVAREKLAATNSQGNAVLSSLNAARNAPAATPAAADAKSQQISSIEQQLGRLQRRRASLLRTIDQLQRRIELLPALVDAQHKIHNRATVSFRVFADVDGKQIELQRAE